MSIRKKEHVRLIEAIMPLFLLGVVGYIAIMYFVTSQRQSTSLVTKASRSAFLTPDDNILSLEEDLKNLSTDPASKQKMILNTIK